MIILWAFVFVIGLCIGSFLNVVILRSLSNESIVFPASKCPKCQHKLYWWHNIPVLSYLILRGKCGFCGEKISIQYPIVELVTGIIFVLLFLKFDFTVYTFISWVIASLFIVLAVTDIKEKVVFDLHTYSLIATGFLCAFVSTGVILYNDYTLLGKFDLNANFLLNNPLTVSVLGALAGFAVMEVFSRIGYIFAGTRAFGEGDSYIAAGLGAIFGWRALLPILILSVIIQICIILPIFVKKEFEKGNKMTLVLLLAFVLYTFGYLFAQKSGLLNNIWIYTVATLAFLALGLWVCKKILAGIKNPENQTCLPFGPALVLAGFVILLITPTIF